MEFDSFLGNIDFDSAEELYRRFRKDPSSVGRSWHNFFKGFDLAIKNNKDSEISREFLKKEFNVLRLIDDYRKRGHLFTRTNPVRSRRKYTPTLALDNYGLSEKDYDIVFHAGEEIGIGSAPLRTIEEHLKQTYCRSIGAEFMYIGDQHKIRWLTATMEASRNTPVFDQEEKKDIFNKLMLAVGFEHFIHKKFTGQKRFSLEGAETLIPAMHYLIRKGAELGMEEFVIGMPHRGRLNVLANVMRKPYEDIFREFMATAYDGSVSLGDVKYHLGFDNVISVDGKKNVRLSLLPNPSHLEAVFPVAEGLAKALIHRKYHDDRTKVCPVILHGDAAIAAQGVVYEVVQMADLEAYSTGGTIHIVINNQVGFTTNYLEARSSTYCTDIAKVTKSPVFHVNGDDVEALVYAVQMAMEYRQAFHSDVFIDILCYRKYGHNEGDEPRFTQPTLYKIIASHPNPMEIYAEQLIHQRIYSQEEIISITRAFDELLEEKLVQANKKKHLHIRQFLKEEWKNYRYAQTENFEQSPLTGVEEERLIRIARKINYLPNSLPFFTKTLRLVKERKKLIEERKADWAMAELLAYGTIIDEKIPVRICGQDSIRGKFSHRHAAHVVQNTDQKYCPLQHINSGQASFRIYNSTLSEYGALGFEYGYAIGTPEGLTIWEAQFGDFHNVAQVIIDQFISSAEDKWGLMNGLVLFLPHGFEGQGPEHSSARLERFLVLAANNNMQLVTCTTPANFFHVLRRQVKLNFRVPLIVFTTKSLLRHPQCISPLSELTSGSFKEVIDDEDVDIPEVKRVVFCSGKIYYDLLARKNTFKARDIALVRIEQLYPFPEKQLDAILEKYNKALVHLWVQEEPENMGAWTYINYHFRKIPLIHVTRLPSGSPATGLYEIHQLEQEEILYKVFRTCDCELKNKYCGLQCMVGKSRQEILRQFNYIFFDKRFNL